MHGSFKSFLPEDLDPREPDVVVEYDYFREERMTRDYPGSPEHCDVTDVLRLGLSVLDKLPAEILERFAEEAMEDATAGPRERED